ILVMDQFPSLNKTYSMVLRVGRQRLVNMQTGDTKESVALHTRWNDNKGGKYFKRNYADVSKGNYRGKGVSDKRSQTCSHCGRTSHMKETCFKLHGVPEWYKDLKDQKRREVGPTRSFTVVTGEASGNSDNASNFGEAVKQMSELIKIMKENIPQQDPLQVNFAHGDEFAGTSALTTSSKNAFGSWIIDTGATNHMCAYPSLLTQNSSPIHKSLVHLPDGTSHSVESVGTLHLSDRFSLMKVLCIPAFKYNLLSMQQLCSSAAVSILFSPSHCWLQDLKTKDVLAVGRVIGGLYILDKHSFDSVNIHIVPVPSSISKCNMSHAKNDTWLWHKRLGHPSFPVMQHIQSIKSPRLWDACDMCHISKQQRLPFPSHHIRSSHIL
ncbi:UNVERIFIED_CONTAM: hypothetical protein Sradi_1762300, partial [Sesamum radiatum]